MKSKRPKSAIFVIERTGAGFTNQTWWINTTREDFKTRAAQELARIKLSKFSRVSAGEGWAS